MSASYTPPRFEIRQLLRAALPTDSDLGAFCIDFFPQSAERFAGSMDRLAKVNLLLELEDADEIITALKRYAPKRLTKYQRCRDVSAASMKNPYRGLAAFQREDAHLFFGREALTSQLWQQFEALYEKRGRSRLLAIVAPSGSGKSSVARAGLLSTLVQSPIPGPQPLRIAIVKPGERPIESLARALVPLLPFDSVVLPASRQIAVEKLLKDEEVPTQGLRRFAADLPDIASSPLCVFVDQLEELYTLCKDAGDRDCFVETLLHAACDSARHVSIVLTLRSDFLGETQRHHSALNRIIAQHGVLVPGLSTDELRDAIAKPAQQAGRPLDAATVELLLAETRDSQGALPLLEFTLTRIWEATERGEEAGTALRKLGGIGGALVGEAQKIYDALEEAEQQTARRALVRLVRLGEGTRDTRRRVPISELCGRGDSDASVLFVLRKFADENARLVTLSSEGAETLAEVTHEALFDHWAELRTWIEESRQDRGLYDRALDAAKLWTQAEKPTGRLWRRPDLDLLRDYQRRKPEDVGPLLSQFLSAAGRRQTIERGLSLGAVAAVIAALLIAAGVYIAKERQRTEQISAASEQILAANEQIHQQLLDGYIDRGRQLLFESDQPSNGLLWLHRAQEEGSKDAALRDLLDSAIHGAGAPTAALIGHRESVLSATYSLDGRRIVTASADETARVWDAGSSQLVSELKGHGASVLSATFSPNGRRVVTASEDTTARVWDAESGRLVIELVGHRGSVRSATYSLDGVCIVTASFDNTARVWEAESGRLVFDLKGHESSVRGATYSPDGRRIVTASDDQTARVWESDSGRLIAVLKGHGDSILSATFSPDGRRIVTASEDQTARVWESNSGRFVVELKGHGARVLSAMYSPDGRRIVTASIDKTARVWDAETGQRIANLDSHGAGVRSATYSPDGRHILTASADKTARLWDAETGRFVAELKGHEDTVYGATYSPDGRHILTTSGDNTARVWESESSRLVSKLKGHEASVHRVTYSPEGRRIVTASEDETARVWDADGGRLIAKLTGHGANVLSATFSPDGRRILTASADETARVWDADSGWLVAKLKGHGASVHRATYSLDGRRIVTASADNTARVWEADSGQLVAELKGHRASVLSATYSPDGHRVVTASADNTGRVWEASSGLLLVELRGHEDIVLSATYRPNGRQIVTASLDKTARLWDAVSGQMFAELKGHGASVYRATYSPEGRRIVTASADNTARVWEADSGQLVTELRGHGGSVLSATWSPDGRRIVTASGDNTARVWEADSGRLLAELKGHVASVWSATYSPDGHHIVTGSADKTARVWDVSANTWTDEQLASFIRCHVPLKFDPNNKNLLVPTGPWLQNCIAAVPPGTALPITFHNP